MTKPEKEGSFKFQKLSKSGNVWLEWTGSFHSMTEARQWYEHTDHGQYFLGKGYTLGLFLNSKQIYPKWM
jgi:hypothetical protein